MELVLVLVSVTTGVNSYLIWRMWMRCCDKKEGYSILNLLVEEEREGRR